MRRTQNQPDRSAFRPSVRLDFYHCVGAVVPSELSRDVDEARCVAQRDHDEHHENWARLALDPAAGGGRRSAHEKLGTEQTNAVAPLVLTHALSRTAGPAMYCVRMTALRSGTRDGERLEHGGSKSCSPVVNA